MLTLPAIGSNAVRRGRRRKAWRISFRSSYVVCEGILGVSEDPKKVLAAADPHRDGIDGDLARVGTGQRRCAFHLHHLLTDPHACVFSGSRRSITTARPAWC